MAKVFALSVSKEKGVPKENVANVILIENLGLEGDAHAATGSIRQISLLANESIKKMQELGLDVKAGNFAENITTEGLDLLALPIGTQLKLGESVILEITQHGKECHSRCAIYEQAGDCVMPTEGIFAKVKAGGKLKTGDLIEVLT